MKTIKEIAQELNDGAQGGMVIGHSKAYVLYTFKVGTAYPTHISYSFQKNLGKNLEKIQAMYPNVLIREGLGADWHSQAHLTADINSLRRELNNTAAKKSCTMPFGKYKGQEINKLTDIDYLCWMANTSTNPNIEGHIEEWLQKITAARATELGALKIGGWYIDRNSTNRFQVNSLNLYNQVQEGGEISYVAEKNNGGIWSAYGIQLPVMEVGHPYYGTCECLNVEGKAKKVKDCTIHLTDYEVNDGIIKVNDFYVTK